MLFLCPLASSWNRMSQKSCFAMQLVVGTKSWAMLVGAQVCCALQASVHQWSEFVRQPSRNSEDRNLEQCQN